MSIRRTRTTLEDHYTQVDNAWARDSRLSLKARGLFVQILTHREGWSISINSLVRANPEGESAIRSGLAELIRYGYLIRGERERNDQGQLGDYEYTLWAGVGVPGVDHPAVDEPTVENPTTKKNILKKEHLQETPPTPSGFDEVWESWPNRKGRKPAEQKWARLSPKQRAEVLPLLIAHANAHRTATPPQYIPMLSTWLNQERWSDPLPVARDRGGRDPEPQRPRGITIPPGHVPIRDDRGNITGSRPA